MRSTDHTGRMILHNGHICLPAHAQRTAIFTGCHPRMRGQPLQPSNLPLLAAETAALSQGFFRERALCRMRAMFTCNQTKVNGENPLLQYNKPECYRSQTLRVCRRRIHTPSVICSELFVRVRPGERGSLSALKLAKL